MAALQNGAAQFGVPRLRVRLFDSRDPAREEATNIGFDALNFRFSSAALRALTAAVKMNSETMHEGARTESRQAIGCHPNRASLELFGKAGNGLKHVTPMPGLSGGSRRGSVDRDVNGALRSRMETGISDSDTLDPAAGGIMRYWGQPPRRLQTPPAPHTALVAGALHRAPRRPRPTQTAPLVAGVVWHGWVPGSGREADPVSAR